MYDAPTDDISARFNGLEQECRRLRRQIRLCYSAGGLALVAVLVLFAAGARRADDRILDAAGLVIRDKDNNPRIILEIADGDPSIRLHDKDGEPRIMMGLGGGPLPTEHPYMNFSAKKGLGALLFGLGGGPFSTEEPCINLRDERGTARLLMGLNPTPQERGKPQLFLRDQNGKPLFQAP